jgi:hypothetical protein
MTLKMISVSAIATPRTIKPALCTSNVCLGKDTGGPATAIMDGAGSEAEPVAGVSEAGFEETAA